MLSPSRSFHLIERTTDSSARYASANVRYGENRRVLVKGREWPVSDREPAANRRSPLHLRLFGHLECVIDLDAEISNGGLELRMAEEQLYGAQILRAAIDQRGFRASQCMGSISGRVEPDLPHPPADDPRVLPCRQMRGGMQAAPGAGPKTGSRL